MVHHTLYSRSIEFSPTFDSDYVSEFVAIEVRIKPCPLIVYVCYLSAFDLEIALKHYNRVKFIVENYREHKMIVIGDFNLHDIIWTPDDEFYNEYLPHATSDSSTGTTVK